jgi:hypothetical protein
VTDEAVAAEWVVCWEWVYQLYATDHGEELADDWYAAMAALLAERAPA